MKKILIAAAMMVIAAGVATGQDKGIVFFEGTIEQACAKAKAEGKQVFIDFYTDWCGPCRALATHVFPEQEAGKYFNPRFICIKIDAEKGDGPKYADEFGVEAYPTFFVIDPDKKRLATWVGGSMKPTTAGFIEKLESKLGTDSENLSVK